MAQLLVIDDDQPTLETYGLMLKAASHAVDLAATMRQAFAHARSRPYDLMLADLFLPDGTAIDLLQALANNRVTTPVIVITGAGSIDTAVEAMRHGAIDYAVKPLVGDDLLAKIDWGLHYLDRRVHPIPVEAHAHAATRWAALVIGVVRAPRDVRTNTEWARLVGVSATTLRDWCRLANTSAACDRAARAVARTRPPAMIDG